jgi:hypothetical protein
MGARPDALSLELSNDQIHCGLVNRISSPKSDRWNVGLSISNPKTTKP